MDLFLIGMNHHTAPLEIRERLVSKGKEDPHPLKEIRALPSITEAYFLATCNRVEIMVATADANETKRAMTVLLGKWLQVPEDTLGGYIYTHKGEDAVRHLFRVASSLDSLIIGEPQILGQVKDAYREATDMGMTGTLLNRALHFSFRTAKRVRTETALAGHAVSVSYAAVELAKKIFGRLDGKVVLIIGAGEMAEIAARHFIKQGAQRLIVTNRTFSRAQELATMFGGDAIDFSHLGDALAEPDIVISSTGASQYILTPAQIAPALRRRRNRLLFLIDIAVPRDIDPLAGKMENVYLFDIDDLQDIADENMKIRREEAKKAEAIVEEETERYRAWLMSLETVPTIVDLRDKAEAIITEELERVGSWLRSLREEDQEAVEILVQSVVKKILHHPITAVKEEHREGGSMDYIAALRRLFKLDD